MAHQLNSLGGFDTDKIRSNLYTSSTKRRTSELHLIQEKLLKQDTQPQDGSLILNLLLPTYAFYIDRPSRQAVQQCLVAVLSSPTGPQNLVAFKRFLQQESAKQNLAPQSRFVLVEWCSVALQYLAKRMNLWEDNGIELLICLARSLEAFLGSNAREKRVHSALVSSRRAVRSLLKNSHPCEQTVEDSVRALTSKGPTSQAGNAPLLGVIAGVASRLNTVRPMLAQHVSAYHGFYAREILASRTVLPSHIANGLRDFFVSFESRETFYDDIVPAVEKSLLRAPEVVLNNLVTPLVNALPSDIDLSEALRTKLLKSLLSNTKSANSSIRDGALTTFRSLVTRSHDEDTRTQVADELLANLKDSKSTDQRITLSSMLAEMIPTQATTEKVPISLLPIIPKETSETALSNEATALAQQVAQKLKLKQAIDSSITKLFLEGLRSKKTQLRRIWALQTASLLWYVRDMSENRPASEFAQSALDNLAPSWDESLSNPVIAATSGLAPVAHILACFWLRARHQPDAAIPFKALEKLSVKQQLKSIDQKQHLLLNPRVYTKLSADEDLFWFSRLLAMIAGQLEDTPEAISSSWAQAVIFSCVSSTLSPISRQNACSTLKDCCRRYPRAVPSTVIDGLWIWIRNLYEQERDSAAINSQTGSSQLWLIARSICAAQEDSPRDGSESVSRRMVDLVVLCRDPLISRVQWIDLSLKAGVDPRSLASSHSDDFIKQIKSHTNDRNDKLSVDTHKAACRAAADLAFVAREEFTSHLLQLLVSDLQPDYLQNIGPEEAAIYRTPEGTAFVDVLSKKNDNNVPNKNVKDYDLLKWEEELRSTLAKKQGQHKKLSAEETAKVKAQLDKESKIREMVAEVATCIFRGLGIIQSLALGPPTDVEAWIGPTIESFFGAVSKGAVLIAGEAAATAYLALSNLTSDRLGTLRLSIGLAALRAVGVARLPEDYTQEPLADLVTRVLYRLRFSGEQRPFDTVSLLYMLPLVHEVLASGGVGKAPGEEADEQITLALEFLSFHLDRYDNLNLPRAHTSKVLIEAMQRFPQHYRSLKECLVGIGRAIAPEATEAEVQVYLDGCIVPQPSVRQTALQVIDSDLDLQSRSFNVEIWLSSHDDQEENAEIARAIWEENELKTSDEAAFEMIPYLQAEDSQLRSAAAKSISACVNEHKDVFGIVLDRLKSQYIEKAQPRVPQKDAYGLPRKTDLRDPWEARHGIARAFKEMSGVFEADKLEEFMRFLIERGPLSDKDERVRDEMVEAASRVANLKGAAKVEELLSVLETTIDSPGSSSAEQDTVKEAVIILYGAVGRHLKFDDPRIPGIVDRLLSTLATPSETVQYAVANCLPPLVQASVDRTSDYLARAIEDLLHSKKYATRRGAAYGLAGIVRGKGIMSLRESRIMSTLKAATEEKKDSNQRQGAFLAYELLSLMLGRTFEPYVIHIVPQLLAGFGDPSADVRDACLDASKTCFSTLSSYGVKQVLPTLLEGLDEVQWRSKKGACDSLGAMAYLDPQQLAISLPDIIPPLTTVLNDSHKEVRGAANRSLQRFGEVISNPEIKGLIDVLLKALSDPTKYTDVALDSLLKISFSHYLDAPSLALVVRILERGLGDRSQTKRKSAQIIGSLAHLTERKDLVSHLPILVSGLRVAAVDPVTATRATASKALGTLVEKLGEDALPDLIPSLMATLKTDTGAGDRLGSAQALSEVLAGLGVGRLEETLPSILQNVSSAKATIREGFMSMFIFLPACFGNSFANYLAKIIPPILSGLADEVESIRETSLRAGRLLVKNFASRAIDLLLPELQRGLGDLNYRIRLSSVELVGDLLFNLTGITARNEDDEEADESSVGAQQSLLEVLGEERRANVLSALYISRCDTSGLVRSSALQVWKALVATPRTLREITPTLTQVIIRRLASPNAEQKHIAGNALGELIRKAGEGVLSTLLPTLEEGLETSVDTDAKQGICIALRELISSASQESLEEYESKLVSVVRTALIDSNVEVREAAAEAFDSLQRMFGKKVIDQILPNLLGLLRDDNEAENALAALLTLLTEQTRSNIILPTLLPTLLASPISTFNARALASLASVAGSSMTRRLSNILNSLLDNIVSCKDEDRREALDTAFDAVILSMDEFDGLNSLMSVMLGLSKNDDHRKRRSTNMHFATFFSKAEIDYSRYHSDLVRALLIAFDDSDAEVVKAAWTALSTLTSRLAKEDMDGLVSPTRQVLGQVGVPGSHLAGFQLPKGINAILPIFLHGLVNGSPDQKIQAALAISEIIDKTSPDALKPFVTNITGPLIRVISERSTDVKAAILVTLNDLLEKIPTFLKPFLPQLQRTFTKSLADPSSSVLRMRAAKALGTLITMTPRIDPLIGELVNGSKTSDPGVKNAMQKALFEVVSRVGKNMNENSRNAVIDLIDNDSSEGDDAAQMTNARLLGALIKTINEDTAYGIVKSRILTSQQTQSSALALNAILLDSPGTLADKYQHETISAICKGLRSSNPTISENSVLAAGKYLLSDACIKNFEVTKSIFEDLVPLMQPGSAIDARRLALVVVRTVARRENDLIRPHLALLVPPVFASVRDPIIPIKLAAEAAFLGIFNIVDEETAIFDKYMAGPGAELPPGPKRAMGDYFKRVALRLASQARERKDAEGGGDGLGLSNDEREDEREIWSVGKIDLGEGSIATS